MELEANILELFLHFLINLLQLASTMIVLTLKE